MATQVSLTDGAVASAGALAIQTNGTTQAVSISTGQVATLAQNPILTSGTANGVAYLNGSKAVTSGSALKFDGTALAIGSVTPSTWMLDVKSAGTGVVTNGIRFNRSNVTTQYGVLNYESGQFNNVVVNTAGTGCFWGVLYSSDGSTTTQPLTLDASGNLGVGTTSPTSRLHVSNSTASTNAIAQFTNGTTGTGAGNGLYVGVDTSNEATIFNFYNSALKFGTNGSERARIDSSGNLGVGTTSTTAVRLIVKGSTTNGTTNAFKLIDSADADILAMSTAGDFYLPKMGSSTGTTVVLTSGNYLVKSSSSIRYKKDVEPIDIGLNFVLGLNPVKYKMKLDDANQVGFIAEDFPDERLVSFSLVNPQDKQSELQRESVNYANLAAPLVKAIQEQQAIIQSLTARITALESA